MPAVVVDTNVSLAATLSPFGMRRRFWIILALGALTYEVEHRRLELDELSLSAEREGGIVHGVERALTRIDEANHRRAALLELLPYGTPDDWIAIGSAPLFDEYERKLEDVGQNIYPPLEKTDIPRLRRQMEVVCVAGAPPFDPDTVPALSPDRKDDPILHTALTSDAELLISEDKHLVPDRQEQFWEHDDRTVTAMTFETLLTDRLDDVSWDEIEGSWLAVAHGQDYVPQEY